MHAQSNKSCEYLRCVCVRLASMHGLILCDRSILGNHYSCQSVCMIHPENEEHMLCPRLLHRHGLRNVFAIDTREEHVAMNLARIPHACYDPCLLAPSNATTLLAIYVAAIYGATP